MTKENGFSDEPIIPNVSEALAFEPVPEAPKQKSRRGRLLTVLVLLTVGAVWFFMDGRLPDGFVGGDGVPIIKAEGGPIKVRPDKPGGMEVPDRDKKVYEQMEGVSGGAQVERLLPPPETPLPPPASAPTPPPPPGSSMSKSLPLPPPPPAAPGDMRKVVKKPLAKAPSAKAPSAKAPSAKAPVKKKKAQKNMAPKILTPIVPTKKDVLSIKPPKQVPSPPPPPKGAELAKKKALSAKKSGSAKKTSGGSKGFFMVQLAAVRTPERAQKEWERLSGAHFEMLGGLELFVTKVDLGPGKGVFYRLRAGPLANEGASRKLCNGLSARKVGCLIVYPGG